MPSRYRYKNYVPEAFYHLYNRGIEKREIFLDDRDYLTFLRMCRHSLTKESLAPLKLDIITFCLMPNHYHFIVKQAGRREITRFVRSFASNYAAYFNERYERVGPLFQGCYKAKQTTTDEGLLQLSRYIHSNPVFAELVARPEDWRWSSYWEYLGQPEFRLCDTSVIFGITGSLEKYREFVEAETLAPSGRELVENLALEKLLF